MVLIHKLTAETLLGTPRRGAAIPNPSGTHALYSLSTHDFQGHTTHKELRVIHIKTGRSEQLSDSHEIHDALWIPSIGGLGYHASNTDDIIYLRSLPNGHTQVAVVNGVDVQRERYVVADIDAPISGLKLKALEDGSVAFVVAGIVGDDGSLLNEESAKKKATSTARIFDNPRVRIWNELFRSQRYSLWYNKLVLQDGFWRLTGDLFNAISSPDLEAPLDMYDVGDPTGGFDVGDKGIAFLARSLSDRRPDHVLFSSPYFIPIESFAHSPTADPRLIERESGSGPGLASNIKISPDGSTIAFLHADEDDQQNARLYTASVESLLAFDIFSLIADPCENDEDYFPPDGFEFAGTSDAVIIQTTRHGRHALAYLKLHDGEKPQIFFHEGSVTSYYPLKQDKWDKLLVSSNSFIDSSLWQIIRIPENGDIDSRSSVVRTISSATKHGLKFGLSANMVTEFWFEGADDYCIHSFMVRPKDFDHTKKYPWVLMPHGGPVSSWQDGWSTRWNMASWAEQGYIVICPNISGSTGYGIEFSKRVDGQWGGNPFQDLLNLITYLESLPYLDQEKAVLAGASYGGYMVSWFFGHEVIKKFCCAVWHDGIFSLPSFSLQSDVIMDNGEYGRSPYPWVHPEEMERWNPARPELLRNWKNAPPTIIIHSEKDYRCPVTEGIACFNTLQAQGVPSRFLTFSDECHWVLSAENSLVWHRTVWDWVRRCVDGEIKRGDTEW